ncbi:uncharacterized protein BDV17DRAFT_289860 [Aspergillus undulatus]|uniref:uncharacterized protein n=1 Tax=Aspergillus undulatus TaxID=1810928 RepID=UPI003CCD7D15
MAFSPTPYNVGASFRGFCPGVDLIAAQLARSSLAASHGANFSGLSTGETALGGSFMKAINIIVSNMIPPLVYVPNLARYATRPSDTMPMSIGLMLSKPVVVVLGMVITAAGYKQFGEAYWNLWDYYASILDNYWSARTLASLAAGIQLKKSCFRTFAFLPSCCSALSQAFATSVTNLTSNSIPVGCDLAGLFPRYFTIVRGQVVCFILAWVCVPWKLTYSATSLITFLGSYLCSLTTTSSTPATYTSSPYIPRTPGKPYTYTHGFNLRAFAA